MPTMVPSMPPPILSSSVLSPLALVTNTRQRIVTRAQCTAAGSPAPNCNGMWCRRTRCNKSKGRCLGGWDQVVLHWVDPPFFLIHLVLYCVWGVVRVRCVQCWMVFVTGPNPQLVLPLPFGHYRWAGRIFFCVQTELIRPFIHHFCLFWCSLTQP